VNLRLEVVQVPVADVDRAKSFYTESVGFHADHDTRLSDAVRAVQLTPKVAEPTHRHWRGCPGLT
jgi:catechol 2,3-dioxygenase-like lactoylglutathione lyase family enzyme